MWSSSAGLGGITLPQASADEARRCVPGEAAESPCLFAALIERLSLYFDGDPVAFDDRLDLTFATPFQRLVWESARRIPYGETRSYGWLARKIGKPQAARAVGQALGKNPFPIIVPCHRVLGGDGSLGGFSGGLAMKTRLLTLEGVSVR